ncbi:MAG TPA: MEDS domain-containing protein [Terriglobales bacterium]|nr:MEDS domain-containing protein [Terriglobales bacterium]
MNDRRQSPLVHSVHMYGSDSELIYRLGAIMIAALASGNATLIVATEAHRRQLMDLMDKEWVNWQSARDEGRLLMLDARETLDLFMVKGLPQPQLFRKTVGELVSTSRLTASSQNRGLTVFGEMVAVLWDEGKKEAAFQLEDLWNQLLSDRAFHLHCAYPKAAFNTSRDLLGMHSICDRHTEVIDHADGFAAASAG